MKISKNKTIIMLLDLKITKNIASQTTINGGSLRDVLKAGIDSSIDTNILKSIAINGLTSGLTTGLTLELTKYLDNNILNNAISERNTLLNQDATLRQQLIGSLYKSTINSTVNTTIQSTIYGESFTETLKNQLINTLANELTTIGTKQIGQLYHSDNLNFGLDGTTGEVLNKLSQLSLHAGLGALSSELTGNDALSGAVSQVSGEIFAEILGNQLYGTTSGNILNNKQKTLLKEFGGLFAGLSALATGKIKDLDANDIRGNINKGQFLGKNVVENNLLSTETVKESESRNNKKNFGPRWKDPKTGKYYSVYKDGYERREVDHLGTDIAAPEKEEIYAAADGVVIRNYKSDTYGNTIILKNTTPDGEIVYSLYAHMYEQSSIPEGSKVQEGQPIGMVGNSGASQGNHLHFGITFGDENGNFSFREGWVDPDKINIGNYDYIWQTPYQEHERELNFYLDLLPSK